MSRLPRARFWLLGAGLIVSLALRAACAGFESIDYQTYLSPWFDHIRSHGGFAALRDAFSNYNVLYLYLLALGAHLPLPKIYAIKAVSIAFDYVGAWAVYRLVARRHGPTVAPVLAALVLLCLPTVVANSALWGQSDMTYGSACLVALYLVMVGRPGWACAAFGLAISFKLQAIFLVPVFAVLVARRLVPARALGWVPVVYLMSVLPAWLLGRPLGELLGIYRAQIETGTVLSANAPNVYQWWPGAAFGLWFPIGLVVALAAVAVGTACLVRSRVWSEGRLVESAMLFAVLTPFLLPKMHERYFFLADIISVVYAWYVPRGWLVSVLVVSSSALAYVPFLAGPGWVDLRVPASSMAVALALVGLRALRLGSAEGAA